MRRKSERTVKNSPIKRTAENATRRTSRRNQKTPENAITEEESENSSDQASSSENEEEVIAPKRGRRSARSVEKSSSAEEVKATPSRQKRKAAAKKDVETIEEEQNVETDEATTADSGEPKDYTQTAESEEHAEPMNVDSSTESPAAKNAADEQSHNSNNDVVEQQPPPEASSNNAETKNDDSATTETNEISSANDAVEIDEATEKRKQSPVKEKRRTLRRLDRAISCEEPPAAVESATTTTHEANSQSNDKSPNENNSHESDEKENIGDSTTKSSDDHATESHKKPNDNSNVIDTTAKEVTTSENDSGATAAKKKPLVRKRKWLSNKNSAPKIQEITISTDSLKGLISDVKPVPLCDVKLDSSPEADHESDDVKVVSSTSLDYNRRSEEHSFDLTDEPSTLNIARKVSIVHDTEEAQPPSPAKHSPCNILFITNLVRPFTVLQLRGLLQRTGKIVENGFWMDKIKSKCFVKYETEDEAIETRHALHGIRWPSSNPKCLNVDFGTENLMEKAIASTAGEAKPPVVSSRDERTFSSHDLRENSREKTNASERPVREWDLGKKADLHRSREQERRPEREGERERNRSRENRDRDRDVRDKERERDRDKRVKRDNEPPLRLLDDLFRKTKTTPCIYWLPLTPEQIAVREEERQKIIQKRFEAMKKDREDRSRDDNKRDQHRDRERGERERGGDRRDNRGDRDRRRY